MSRMARGHFSCRDAESADVTSIRADHDFTVEGIKLAKLRLSLRRLVKAVRNQADSRDI
jgi:hypothetical protein